MPTELKSSAGNYMEAETNNGQWVSHSLGIDWSPRGFFSILNNDYKIISGDW